MSDKPLLIDFTAPDCSTCQTMMLVWEELKEALGGMIDFSEVDINDYPSVIRKFDIRNTPTFILFVEGEEVWRHVGLMTLRKMKEELVEAVRQMEER